MKEEESDYVILVNPSGRKKGIAKKLEAHQQGLLHRAFSIFIFNKNGEMLLQKRASSKYHFAGLWTNACCSHPRPGEAVLIAAKRRLEEELGFSAPLKLSDHIIYSFKDDESGLTEHEYDYLISGEYNGKINPDSKEVETIKWISPSALSAELKKYPQRFTPWFQLIVREKKL